MHITLSAPVNLLLCYYYWKVEAEKNDLQWDHSRF